jgi:hypothetical protein
MMREKTLIRNKKYKMRRIGARGIGVAVPQYFLDRFKIQAGDECLQMVDENSNLVLVFRHSPDWDVSQDDPVDTVSGP